MDGESATMREKMAERGVQQEIGWHASGRWGAIAAGAPESVTAGLDILAQGGNAADAAVATILALNVTDHGACSIGGEVPLMIYRAEERDVKVLSGQGGAPLSEAAIDWYMQNGIPEDNVKMAPVPSVVDLCITTLRCYGTMTFQAVAAPAVALLDRGVKAWHPRLAVTLRRMIDEETFWTGSREEKLQAACDRFYGRNAERNDIAEELEAYYIENGGFLRRRDLAAHFTRIEAPVTVNYRGYTVCKCGPWTQGPFLCQTLRLLEGFDLRSMGRLSADYIHVVVEALKLAMADRDEYYGDPNFVEVPLRELFSDQYTQLRRPLVDLKRASLEARPGDPYGMNPLKGAGVFRPKVGGTTTCVVSDRWGNLVAATPSANVHGHNGGRAGVTYGNRLVSLNTCPTHPNCIAPGKRPCITLTPTLVLKEGEPVLAVSVAGGDLQDQCTLNLLLDFIDFGIPPKSAVVLPRFATAHHQDSFDPDPDPARRFGKAGSLSINDAVSDDIRADLEERGQKVEITEHRPASPTMLHLDPATGIAYAAGDPDHGRHAGSL